MNIRRSILAALAGFCSVVCFALIAQGEPPAAPGEDHLKAVRTLVGYLDAPDPAVRMRAATRLESVNATDLPLLQDALKNGDLSGQAKRALTKVLSRLGPRLQLVAKRSAHSLVVGDWTRGALLEDAKKHAKTAATTAPAGTEPAWLSAVEKTMDLAQKIRSAPDAATQKALRTEELKQIDAALAASCDDPGFMTFAAVVEADSGDSPDKTLKLLTDAHTASKSAKINPYMLVVLDGRLINASLAAEGLNQKSVPQLVKLYGELVNIAVSVIKDSAIPAQVKLAAANSTYENGERLHIKLEPVYNTIMVPLEAQLPNDAQQLCLKGKFYIKLAWESRGGGYANTVTPQQWKDFAARLEIANDMLSKSYDLDPQDPEAATQMLTVIMGQDGARPAMETWFKRAMDANPDNYEACSKKLYYLEPKWHGDAESMIEFGRECLDAGNWHKPEIPMLLIEAHDNLSKYEQDPAAYYRKAGVWEDLQRTCTEALEQYPKSAPMHNQYCRYACLCEEWKIADTQFKLLGDKVDVKLFGGKESVDLLKKKAAELGADK